MQEFLKAFSQGRLNFALVLFASFIILKLYQKSREKNWAKSVARITKIEPHKSLNTNYYDVVFKDEMGREISQRTSFFSIITDLFRLNKLILNVDSEVPILFKKTNPQKIEIDCTDEIKKMSRVLLIISIISLIIVFI